MPDRQSRRSVLATIAALPLTGALSACSSSDGASQSGSTSNTTTISNKGAQRATHITFWSALRGSQEVVDAFNRTHDLIQVDFQQIPTGGQGGYAKLSNAFRAGNAPDVATIEYPQVPGFAIDGVARELTDLIGDGLRAKLLPQALGLTTSEKRVFSVPLDVEPMMLHYRTDLFQQYGLEVPRTWDEFEEAARTVRRKAPDRRLATFATDGAMQFAALAWQAGAQWFDTSGGAWNVSLTDEPTRRVASYWQRLIDQDLVFMNAVDSRQSDAQISNGQVLARLSGAWDAGAQMNARPAQKGKWAVAPLPQWDPAKPSSARTAAPRSRSPRTAGTRRPPWSSSSGRCRTPTHCAPGSPAAAAASTRPPPVSSLSAARPSTAATTRARTSTRSSRRRRTRSATAGSGGRG